MQHKSNTCHIVPQSQAKNAWHNKSKIAQTKSHSNSTNRNIFNSGGKNATLTRGTTRPGTSATLACTKSYSNSVANRTGKIVQNRYQSVGKNIVKNATWQVKTQAHIF
jgi:hypothetical protein